MTETGTETAEAAPKPPEILRPSRNSDGGYNCFLIFEGSSARVPYSVHSRDATKPLQAYVLACLKKLEAENPDAIEDAPPPEPVVRVCQRHQLEIWLDENGWPGGLENPDVVAAAESASARASIRRRSAQSFLTTDDLIVALAAALPIDDLDAAFIAAAAID